MAKTKQKAMDHSDLLSDDIDLSGTLHLAEHGVQPVKSGVLSEMKQVLWKNGSKLGHHASDPHIHCSFV